MDRRQRKTRETVFRAFTTLMEKKPYSSITVQEIIDAADIGRSTFYAHFETKDDLLKALYAEIFDHVFRHPAAHENTHDFSESDGNVKIKLTHMLYHLQDNRRYIRGLFASNPDGLSMTYFQQYLENALGEYVDKDNQTIPPAYLLHHIVTSFAETVRWWICERHEYSPEEVANFFLAVVPYGWKVN